MRCGFGLGPGRCIIGRGLGGARVDDERGVLACADVGLRSGTLCSCPVAL